MPESNTRANKPLDRLTVELNNQSQLSLDDHLVQKLVSRIVHEAGFHHGVISVAIVSDRQIHELNRQYLQHDYPTDVLSFPFETDRDRQTLSGEIVISFETAQKNAVTFDSDPLAEVLLYLVHGALHLVGFNDSTDPERKTMREMEQKYLRSVDLETGQ